MRRSACFRRATDLRTEAPRKDQDLGRIGTENVTMCAYDGSLKAARGFFRCRKHIAEMEFGSSDEIWVLG